VHQQEGIKRFHGDPVESHQTGIPGGWGLYLQSFSHVDLSDFLNQSLRMRLILATSSSNFAFFRRKTSEKLASRRKRNFIVNTTTSPGGGGIGPSVARAAGAQSWGSAFAKITEGEQ
jgi:hypothetical protein